MSLWVDRRGQSVVIGSLLIFTFLILAFSGYQTFIVPSQNQQVEAEHFQETEEQFSTLRSNIINSIDSEETRSTAIELGTGYPVRQIALNPPPAAGRLTTTEPGEVTFDGVSENVCRADGGTPTTRSLVYTPGYNEYGAPEALGYENRVVSGEFRSGRFDEQRLVRESSSGNDRISLFLLNGSVDEYGVNTYSLEVNASRQHTTELTNPIITIPSRFDATTWRNEILADYSDVTVTSVPADDRVTLTFNGGDYDVSCAVAGLDRDPAFTPPDDGGDGGGGGGSTAYSVSWESPNGEPGTKSCSADDCTLDESAGSVELTAKTDPKAQGAPVEFSVSDQSVAKVSPGSNNTGVNGKTTTTLIGQSNGTAQVFASSSGSGDVINFTIIQGKTLDKGSTIVYEGVNAVEGDNGTKKSLAPEGAQALGPPNEDLTENGTNDLPYVKDGNLKIVDSDGNRKTLVNEGDDRSPSTSKTLMAVGTWDGSDTSVFYADGGKIYRVDGNGTVTEVAEPDNGAGAVMGTGDIDGDDDTELLFAGSSQEVRYLEQDGTTGTLGVTAASNNGGGVGQPHDFDGDGTVRAVIVDGSNYIRILGEAEPDKTFGDTSAKKAPVTTADVDGDGESEIVYVGNDNEKIKYIDDPLNDPQIEFLNDKDGNKVDAGDKLGVVS